MALLHHDCPKRRAIAEAGLLKRNRHGAVYKFYEALVQALLV